MGAAVGTFARGEVADGAADEVKVCYEEALVDIGDLPAPHQLGSLCPLLAGKTENIGLKVWRSGMMDAPGANAVHRA